MDILKKRILEAGQYLGKGILKVDGFINHQVDPKLMDQCGKEFSELFKDCGATRILTAEISGIAPALMTGYYLDLPVVYARKHKPVTMPDQVFLTLAPSHTKGRTVELIVSPEYLKAGERILIIDDFLASGATIAGVVRLVTVAGAELVGIWTLIEKLFDGGRAMLLDQQPGLQIESLACITKMDDSGLEFRD